MQNQKYFNSGQFHQHFMNAFAPIFLPQKSSNLKCEYKKALRETFAWKSRSLKSMLPNFDFFVFYQILILRLAILKYRQYFPMLQTLKLNNKKWKKSSFYGEKSLVGLTSDLLSM